MASNPKSQTRKTLPIDLALQGGGSHGAFTWGVLGRILEEKGGDDRHAAPVLNLHWDGTGARAS